MSKGYWRICAESISDELSLDLNSSQLDEMAEIIGGWRDNESMGCGYPSGVSSEDREIKELKRALEQAREDERKAYRVGLKAWARSNHVDERDYTFNRDGFVEKLR